MAHDGCSKYRLHLYNTHSYYVYRTYFINGHAVSTYSKEACSHVLKVEHMSLLHGAVK